jgi:putative transposase
MAPLCREFGISRVTGYKIYNRYKDCGLDGLYDRSRAPYRQANKLPYQVERAILGIKKEHPSWGAPKIRAKLIRDYPMIPTPAVSTIHAVLDRNNLVKRRKRKRHKAKGTTLVGSETPNGLWCADYKGEFLLGNHQYCYPLTISDYRSRYLLACDGLESTKSDFAFSVFERTFKDFGLPALVALRNLRPVQALGMVVAPRHRYPAHQARTPRAEWASRTHTSHAQAGGHQAGLVQLPAAAGTLRRLHGGLQQ